MWSNFSFFFQAEDGIRDSSVTGVQTCALPILRERKECALGLLREILAQGQNRGEVSGTFPVEHLAEFMEGLYNTIVRQWAVDLTGPHKLSERVSSAVEFFLRGVRP